MALEVVGSKTTRRQEVHLHPLLAIAVNSSSSSHSSHVVPRPIVGVVLVVLVVLEHVAQVLKQRRGTSTELAVVVEGHWCVWPHELNVVAHHGVFTTARRPIRQPRRREQTQRQVIAAVATGDTGRATSQETVDARRPLSAGCSVGTRVRHGQDTGQLRVVDLRRGESHEKRELVTTRRREAVAQRRPQTELRHGRRHINFERQAKGVRGVLLLRRRTHRLTLRHLNRQRVRRVLYVLRMVDLLLDLLVVELLLLHLLFTLLLLAFLAAEASALGDVELRHFFSMCT